MCVLNVKNEKCRKWGARFMIRIERRSQVFDSRYSCTIARELWARTLDACFFFLPTLIALARASVVRCASDWHAFAACAVQLFAFRTFWFGAGGGAATAFACSFDGAFRSVATFHCGTLVHRRTTAHLSDTQAWACKGMRTVILARA